MRGIDIKVDSLFYFKKGVKMKKQLFFSLMASFLILFELVSAQQDPYDPYEADTLYSLAGGQHSADEETLYLPPNTSIGDVIILINFWNDNQVQGFSVPVTDDCYGPPGNAFLDPSKNSVITEGGYPICFEGSRVANLGFGFINLALNPPDVLYGMVCTTSVEPGQGLFCTMVCTVSDTTTICLDTTFFPPENTLKFVEPGAMQGYRPIFFPDTFHVGWRPNEPPNPFSLISPQGDTLADAISLNWQEAIDPDLEDTVKYCVYYGTSVTFHPDSTTEICDLTDSSCEITHPYFYITHYWKVKAYDPYGLETWSDEAFSFYPYVSMDANCDGAADIVDVVYKVNFLFKGGDPPCMIQVADHTCDDGTTIADVVCEINYLFKGGPKSCCPERINF